MSKIALITGNSSLLASNLIPLLESNDYLVISTSSKNLDLTSDESCKRSLSQIIKKYNRLDLIVNIAGVSLSGPGLSFTPSDLNKLFDINTTATFRLLKYSLPYLSKSSPGKFIAICSLSGLVPFPNYSLYTASKYALRGLCLSLFHELLSQNIFLTCVYPGAIFNPQVKISPNSARGKFPFLKWLLPLTTYRSVSESILKLVKSTKPIPEISIGRDSVLISLLYRYFPSRIWHLAQNYIWQRQK